MSLTGEIITAFVAAVGTVATTVGLVAYMLRDLRVELEGEIQVLRTEVRSDIQDVRGEIRQLLVELLHHVQSGHHPPPQAA